MNRIISRVHTIFLENNNIEDIYKCLRTLPLYQIKFSYDTPHIAHLYLNQNEYIKINILEEMRSIKIDKILS
jgi:hypothetical protein